MTAETLPPMHTRGPVPASFLPTNLATHPSQSAVFVRIYFEFSQLKRLYRQGWIRRGIAPEVCETVAEHTLGVALLALFLRDAYFQELDLALLLKLALLHDLAEARVGDITPAHRLAPEEKHRLEREGFAALVEGLAAASEYLALWDDYEARRSPEARLIHQLDRLEMALQASVYEQEGLASLGDFFTSAGKVIALPELKAIFELLQEMRSVKSLE